MTTTATDRDTFLALRRVGIGGSDVSAVIGISPWATPLDVFLEKKGRAESKPESEPMWWGSHQEPLLAMRYEILTGRTVVPAGEMLTHPDEPWAVGNLDGRVEGDPSRIIELKTTRWASPEEWGPSGTDEVPLHYITQVQWYLWLAGAEVCDVVALLGGSETRIYEVPRDDALIAQLVERCRAFWRDHVLADIPPGPTTSAEAFKVWPQNTGDMRVATTDDLQLLDERGKLKTEISDKQHLLDKVELGIKSSIGDADGLADEDGAVRCTWKAQTSKRLDSKRFKAEAGDTYNAFLKETRSRVLRVKEVRP